MKLKIGEKEFTLNNYNEVDNKGNIRPYIFFYIEANYNEIYPLTQVENQTYFIIFDNEEVKDVSSKCVLFGSCNNIGNSKCELVMNNYSDTELLQSVIDDLLNI